MNSLDDEQFFQLCQLNRRNGVHFERDKNGKIYFMSPTGQSPTGSIGGKCDLEIAFEIMLWSKKSGKGFAFGPATGFTLPDTSVNHQIRLGFLVKTGKKYQKDCVENLHLSVQNLWLR